MILHERNNEEISKLQDIIRNKFTINLMEMENSPYFNGKFRVREKNKRRKKTENKRRKYQIKQ